MESWKNFSSVYLEFSRMILANFVAAKRRLCQILLKTVDAVVKGKMLVVCKNELPQITRLDVKDKK